jgi:transcriptional antiterminator NusG
MKEMSEQTNEVTETTNGIPVYHERFKWFAVMVQPGMEKKAKAGLEERIKKLKMEEFFGMIHIPIHSVEKIDTQGKKKMLEQRLMPGYMFIQMDPTKDQVFSFVKETPKISSFIGASHSQKPNPVPEDEIDRIVNRVTARPTEQSKPKTIFHKGEKVKVIDGPFTNFTGDIDEVKADKMKLRLLISVFGRATPVEIEFNKVEKIEDAQ